MKTQFAVVLTLLLVASALPTAASDSYLVESWKAERSDAHKHATAIVVGIFGADERRKPFENKMVSHLRGREIEAATSYSIVPDLANPESRNEVADKLVGSGVDAVLTVRAIPASAARDGDYVTSWESEATDELDVRSYVLGALGTSDPDAKRYVIEIGVWDMSSRSRIWAARTELIKAKRLEELAGTLMQEAIDRLERDSLF